jgi:elongator complex protein 3
MNSIDQHLLNQLVSLLQESIEAGHDSSSELEQIIKSVPRSQGGHFKKSHIIAYYRDHFASELATTADQKFISSLRMKPIRSLSGVAPITVLTKPFACPGKCIFCPNDVRMPKSYISSEPGAQRAKKNHFDPYLQTYNRLSALHQIGHNVDKAEIIVLGGTWSIYPEEYQIWFIKRCFEALNDFGEGLDQRAIILPSVDVSKIKSDKRNHHQTYNQTIAHLYHNQEKVKSGRRAETASWEELAREQIRNTMGKIRCVGLVLETRPDAISENEVVKLRRFGCTKTQIGLQSLQDLVLAKNHRGHDVEASRRAMQLLRLAGLKIHVHWMPNLYGSTVANDIKDYQTLFSDPDFKPDEIKIYPCSLIGDTELVTVYEQGLWQPYTHDELLAVLVASMSQTPEYCRITRVVRDIPSTEIVSGNKITNFRQLAEMEVKKKDLRLSDIRAREIKGQSIIASELVKKTFCYRTSVSIEYFIQFVTKTDNKIAAFLRLSLPTKESFIKELKHSAIIREVHVYGEAIQIGDKKTGKPQHLGLGKKLIKDAEKISKEHQYKKVSVISAIGTREYYKKQDYILGDLYQTKKLVD